MKMSRMFVVVSGYLTKKKIAVTKRPSRTTAPIMIPIFEKIGKAAEETNVETTTTSTIQSSEAPPKRSEKNFQICQQLLNRLMNNKAAPPFLQPVDPIALGIPGYFDIIKNPMVFCSF